MDNIAVHELAEQKILEGGEEAFERRRSNADSDGEFTKSN